MSTLPNSSNSFFSRTIQNDVQLDTHTSHKPQNIRKRKFQNAENKDTMKVTVKGKRPYVVAREALHQVSNMEKILNSTKQKLEERTVCMWGGG